jgi:alginate O-acetyltransferase complex protein AlgI
MKFQSVLYLCLLTLMWLIAMALRRPALRRVALLLASYFFYLTWGAAFVLVLVASSLFNFLWGRLLLSRRQASVLWIGLAVNILLLASFKYVPWLLGAFGIGELSFLSVLAPVGLSFYTFQAMSHLIDVYRDNEGESNPTWIEFFLYMAFWPTVLAGPICRVNEMVPQLRRMENPNLDDVSVGVRRILFGLFMKVVLADMLGFGLLAGEGLNTGFNSLSSGWSGLDVWFLAIGFGFQLYFDFAGYSHMAIGSARLFGIRLRENFDDPYLSRTPSEFWTRWHISLSTWIRDYLFFPLAMVRREFSWRIFATVISMTIFGLWHGAGATFLLWGIYQGLLLAAHRIIQHVRTRYRKPDGKGPSHLFKLAESLISWAATFGLISLGWVLFRANNLKQAGTMLRSVFTPADYFKLSLRPNFYIMVATVALGYFVYIGLRYLIQSLEKSPLFARVSWLASPVLYCAMIVAVIVWSRQAATFVYMQF